MDLKTASSFMFSHRMFVDVYLFSEDGINCIPKNKVSELKGGCMSILQSLTEEVISCLDEGEDIQINEAKILELLKQDLFNIIINCMINSPHRPLRKELFENNGFKDQYIESHLGTKSIFLCAQGLYYYISKQSS